MSGQGYYNQGPPQGQPYGYSNPGQQPYPPQGPYDQGAPQQYPQVCLTRLIELHRDKHTKTNFN